MTKRTYKWSAQSKKDKVGCMWALVHIFDFRRSQKLLSDQKHGSSRHSATAYARSKLSNCREIHESIYNVDEDRERQVSTFGVSSVKTLMEKEMARPQSLKRIPINEDETLPSEMISEVHSEKNHKQARQKLKAVLDVHVNELRAPGSLEFNGRKCMSSTEGSDIDFDMAALMVEICRDHIECEHIDCKDKTESCSIVNKKHTDNYNSSPDQIHSYLQKALDDAAEAVIRNKFVDKKNLNGSKGAQSKELVNLMRILRSNKELSLKLLKDPELHIVEYIQNLHKNQSDKVLEEKELVKEIGSSEHPKEFPSNEPNYKQNKHRAFWKKDKSKGSNPWEESVISQAYSRIVVLKPGPARSQSPLITNTSDSDSSPPLHHSLQTQEDGRRVASHFSLREIKRRMKHVIGENRKERNLTSMDGVLHKVAYVQKDSADADKQLSRKSLLTSLASRTSSKSENYFRLSSAANKMELKDCQLSIENDVSPSRDRFSFYDEAKKHLTEMLHNQNQNDNLPNRQVPKSLARLLSLTKSNLSSPKYSPEKERKADLPLKEAELSTLEQFKQDDDAKVSTQSRQGLESTTSNVCTFVTEQVLDPKAERLHTQVQEATCSEDKINPEGSREMTTTFDTMCLEGCEFRDVSSDSACSEGCVLNETFSEERLKKDPLEEEESLDHPNSPENIIEKPGRSSMLTVVETSSEKAEQQSPISVLELFFSEDTINPSCKSANHTELTIEHSPIQLKEHDICFVPLSLPDSWSSLSTVEDNKARFAYTTSVLEASGLTVEDVSERLYIKDQLLDPSFFYEVRIPSNLTDDPKILFDCIAEVIIEMQEKYFRFAPWLSFANRKIRPAPVGVNLILEVCKLVDWHLRDQFPSTLDEILGNDLEGGTWMNLQAEIESIIIEAWDDILDDILEEAVFDMWLEI